MASVTKPAAVAVSQTIATLRASAASGPRARAAVAAPIESSASASGRTPIAASPKTSSHTWRSASR